MDRYRDICPSEMMLEECEHALFHKDGGSERSISLTTEVNAHCNKKMDCNDGLIIF